MNNPVITLIGFILFLSGMVALMLSMVGLQIAPLVMLDGMGVGYGLLFKVILVIIGIILIYVSRTKFDGTV